MSSKNNKNSNQNPNRGNQYPSNDEKCPRKFQLLKPIDQTKAKNEVDYIIEKRKKRIRKIKIFCVFSGVFLLCYLALNILAWSFGSGHRVNEFINTHIIGNTAHPLLRTAISAIFGYIIITAAHFLIKLLSIGKSKRRKTIVVIIASFVKYIGYIVLLIIVFNIWELDSAIIAAVLAALGIALGFGAQGLISDLLTGIFMIFENSLQVGDIVTFNDYRGEVEEIGIRTTKIRHINGNVKIINNSELRVFINMTMHRAVAACDLTIEYGENVIRVEDVINGHLKVLAEKYPVITEGPVYKGVFGFNEKGVKMKVVAKCHESERLQLERDMNREFKLLFDEHKIRFAVPKIELVDRGDGGGGRGDGDGDGNKFIKGQQSFIE